MTTKQADQSDEEGQTFTDDIPQELKAAASSFADLWQSELSAIARHPFYVQGLNQQLALWQQLMAMSTPNGTQTENDTKKDNAGEPIGDQTGATPFASTLPQWLELCHKLTQRIDALEERLERLEKDQS